MRIMLIGGGSLLAVIVAGVIYAFNSGESVSSAIQPIVETSRPDAQPAAVAKETQRSQAVLAMEAEPIARKFMEAKTIDEILPLVRNPEITAERLRATYPDGAIPASGFSEFDSDSATISGRFVSFVIRTRDYEPKTLVFIDEPGGLKIDWESSVGWSEMAWQEFLESKPVTPHDFRLILSPVEYYNFEFSDDVKWQSYLLESPDKLHAVYGYVEKGSVLDEQIRLDSGTKSGAMTLSLKFREGATSSKQVLIDRLVTDGWIEMDL